MEDRRVDKGLLTRKIARGLAALVLFETAVDERSGVFGRKPGFPALGHEQRILGQQPFGEVLVVREKAAAIAGGKTRRNQFQVVAPADAPGLFEPDDVIGWLDREPVVMAL